MLALCDIMLTLCDIILTLCDIMLTLCDIMLTLCDIMLTLCSPYAAPFSHNPYITLHYSPVPDDAVIREGFRGLVT